MAVELSAIVEGPSEAPAVVMIHGLGSGAAMWAAQAAVLAERYRVIRPELRGHGDSPPAAGHLELGDLGQDVIALVDELGADRFSVVGISMGGAIGLWLAARHAERVDRLVACATSARFGQPEAWAQRAEQARGQGTVSLAAVVAGRWLTPEYAERHPQLAASLRDGVTATEDGSYAACCEAIQRWDFTGELGAITAPTLVISGADDPSTPPEHQRLIASGIPGARLEVLSPAAHLVNLERADEVTAMIIEHLT